MDSTEQLKQVILELASERGPGKSICPSEAVRTYACDEEDKWRPMMEPVRQAAAELQKLGEIDILQNGEPVDLDEVSGPIRLSIKE